MTLNAASKILNGSLPTPENIRESVERILDLLKFERDELNATYGRGEKSLKGKLDEDPFLEGESLIAIIGQRGAGKSTLLASACHEIKTRTSDLVLPVMRPELLGHADSIVPNLIASLWPHLTAERENATDRATASDPFKMRTFTSPVYLAWQSATSAATYSTDQALKVLTTSRESIGQYAADVTAILRERLNLAGSLAELLSLFRTEILKDASALVILPIDDADLVPSYLGKLLADLRLLSNVPGLVPIICASRDDLRDGLYAEHRVRLGNAASVDKTARAVEQQIAKTVRPDRVIELRAPANHSRLEFRPLGESESLEELMGRLSAALFPRTKDSLSAAVRGGLIARGAAEPQGAIWLPDTMRGLEHLWRVLGRLVEALESSTYTPAQVVGSLQDFTSEVLREDRDLQIELDGSPSKGEESGLSVVARWPRVSLGSSAIGSWHPVAETRRADVQVRYAYRPIGHVDTAEGTGEGASRSLSRDEVSKVLLIQEILSADVLSKPKPTGGASIGESTFVFLQSVTLLKQTTDDTFLMLPSSVGLVHVERAFTAWNWIVELTERRLTAPSASYSTVFTGLVHAATKFWLQGQESALDERPNDLAAAMQDAASTYLDCEASSPEFAPDRYNLTPEQSFCRWFEELLPMGLNSLLLEDAEMQEASEIWRAALAASSRGRAAIAAVRRRFIIRLDAAGIKTGAKVVPAGVAWLYGYRGLFELLATDLVTAVKILASDFQERSGQGSRGHDAVEDLFVLSEETGSYKFRKRESVEGQEEEQLLMRVLTELRR